MINRIAFGGMFGQAFEEAARAYKDRPNTETRQDAIAKGNTLCTAIAAPDGFTDRADGAHLRTALSDLFSMIGEPESE